MKKIANILTCIALVCGFVYENAQASVGDSTAKDSTGVAKIVSGKNLRAILFVSPMAHLNSRSPAVLQIGVERPISKYGSLLFEAGFLRGNSRMRRYDTHVKYGARLRAESRTYMQPIHVKQRRCRSFLGLDMTFKHMRLNDWDEIVPVESDPDRLGHEYLMTVWTRDYDTLLALAFKQGVQYQFDTQLPIFRNLAVDFEWGLGAAYFFNGSKRGFGLFRDAENKSVLYGSLEFRIGYILR